jgi:phospholipid/cholesterol/gamma-HCH transport system substrate-binding protein
MQRNIAETVLGAVVLLVAGGFLFFFYRTTDIKPASGYEITAAFSKIDGLEAGSPVRISGVKVGQVLGFELDKDTYHAIVHMNIDSSVKLPKDTSAVIASAGLLDGKFMTLQPGGDDEPLKPGDRIEFTQSTPSLEQMLGQVIFSMNKKGGDGDNDGDDKSAAPKAAHGKPHAAGSDAHP